MLNIKRKYIIWFVVISIIGFILPYLFKAKSESFNSAFSSSFTFLSCMSSVATLIVAIALFDRFGVNTKFTNRQIDKVLELAKIITKMRFQFSNGKLVYLYSVKKAPPELELMPDFSIDRKKIILIQENYIKETEILYNFISDAWLPKSIKDKLGIFNVYATATLDNSSYDNFICLSTDRNNNGDWLQTIPAFTFEFYAESLYALFEEVENWLKKHSRIPIDYRGGDI